MFSSLKRSLRHENSRSHAALVSFAKEFFYYAMLIVLSCLKWPCGFVTSMESPSILKVQSVVHVYWEQLKSHYVMIILIKAV